MLHSIRVELVLIIVTGIYLFGQQRNVEDIVKDEEKKNK